MARAVLPPADPRKLAILALVVAFGIAGCGGGGKTTSTFAGVAATGDGYTFEVPAGWKLVRGPRSLQARESGKLVSVTTFRLAHRYRSQLFPKVVPELDRVARELAAQEHGTIQNPRTLTIAGRRARAYEIARPGSSTERIAFVLDAKREYQLFCRDAGDECDRLLGSFTIR